MLNLTYHKKIELVVKVLEIVNTQKKIVEKKTIIYGTEIYKMYLNKRQKEKTKVSTKQNWHNFPIFKFLNIFFQLFPGKIYTLVI